MTDVAKIHQICFNNSPSRFNYPCLGTQAARKGVTPLEKIIYIFAETPRNLIIAIIKLPVMLDRRIEALGRECCSTMRFCIPLT